MRKSESPAVKSQVCRHQAIKEKRKNENTQNQNFFEFLR